VNRAFASLRVQFSFLKSVRLLSFGDISAFQRHLCFATRRDGGYTRGELGGLVYRTCGT
jgi:hypothetical protein